MDATSFAGTFLISNRRRESSTSTSGSSGSSVSGSSYGSVGSSYGSTPSNSGSYFPQSSSNTQNSYGNKSTKNYYNSSNPFQILGKNPPFCTDVLNLWIAVADKVPKKPKPHCIPCKCIHSDRYGLAFVQLLPETPYLIREHHYLLANQWSKFLPSFYIFKTKDMTPIPTACYLQKHQNLYYTLLHFYH